MPVEDMMQSQPYFDGYILCNIRNYFERCVFNTETNGLFKLARSEALCEMKYCS